MATEVGDELLADREDVPLDHHSVIFDINKLTDHDAYEEDRGEATRISGPPQGMLASQMLDPGPSFGGADTQAEMTNDPTLISDAPSARPRRASRAVPQEIIVPRSRAPEMLAGSGAPRRGDLTPTPIEDEERLAPLHLPEDDTEDDEAKTLPPELHRPDSRRARLASRAVPQRAAPPPRPRRAAPSEGVRRPRLTGPVAPPHRPGQAEDPTRSWGPAADAQQDRLTFGPGGGEEEQTWAPPPRSGARVGSQPRPAPAAEAGAYATAGAGPQKRSAPPLPPAPPSAALQPRAPAPQPFAPAPQPFHPQPQPLASQPPSAFGQAQGFSQPSDAFGQALSPGEQMMPRRRRGLGLAVLLAVVIVGAAIAVAVLVLWPISAQEPLIHVTSVPAGATVSVDGKRVPGVTPLQIAVPDAKRSYRVRVTLTNHEPYESVAQPSGDPAQVQIVAPMNPLLGTLEIESTPSVAYIYINDELRGHTPKRLTGISLGEDLAFELRKRGYRSVKQKVRWGGQTYHKVRITLHKSR